MTWVNPRHQTRSKENLSGHGTFGAKGRSNPPLTSSGRHIPRSGDLIMTLLGDTLALGRHWSTIFAALRRDPMLGSRFVEAPAATLRRMGYEVTAPTLAILQAALP